MHCKLLFCVATAMLLASCGQGENANVPGDTGDKAAYAGIAQESVIVLNGTEPFWGGHVERGTFIYTTPENIGGTRISVSRFAGRGGLSFSGELDGQPLDLAVTPGDCSDGMSDRIYPFVATLQIGSEQRSGCASLAEDEPGEP